MNFFKQSAEAEILYLAFKGRSTTGKKYRKMYRRMLVKAMVKHTAEKLSQP